MEPARMVLDYSMPREARRWGPALFRPRRRTVALIVLLIATVIWLVRRHEPWHWVAELPCDQLESPRRGYRALNATFTPDGLLLFDTTGGARLYDAANGSFVRTVLTAVDAQQFHYFAFESSRHVLALPNPQNKRAPVAIATLYDRNGQPIAEFPRLGEEDQRVVV